MQTKVPKLLDMKTKIWGLEIVDLLLVFGMMAFLNRLLSQYPYKLFFVWGISGVLWLSLWFLKRGQPDRFLKQMLSFYFAPACFDVGKENSLILRKK